MLYIYIYIFMIILIVSIIIIIISIIIIIRGPARSDGELHRPQNGSPYYYIFTFTTNHTCAQCERLLLYLHFYHKLYMCTMSTITIIPSFVPRAIHVHNVNHAYCYHSSSSSYYYSYIYIYIYAIHVVGIIVVP